MTDTTTAAAIEAAETPAESVVTGPEVSEEHSYGARYITRITLAKPIERMGTGMEPVRVLYMREPTAGDLRGVSLVSLSQVDVSELITLLPRIAMPKLAPAEVNGLGLRDTIAIGGAVAGFLQ